MSQVIPGVFVFGSNLAGRHGAGAAKYALRTCGAIYGQGEGRQGSSYAIPTKDASLKTLSLLEIGKGINRFCQYAALQHMEVFLLTPIGCGLAGHSPKDIWKLLYENKIPSNVVLLPSWVNDHNLSL